MSLAVLAVLAGPLGGCAAVGPNYAGPPEVAGPAVGADAAFHRAAVAPVSPAPPPARWWEAVGDPTLTRLIDDAFAASPTLAGAVGRVRSARAQQAQNRAALGPTGSVGGRYVRGKIPTGSFAAGSAGGEGGAGGGTGGGSSIPDPIDLDSYSVTTNATWEIDLFGGKRRNIESAAAAADAQQAQLEDAQVTLASDMAQAYARLREAQNRVALAQRTVELRTDALALTRHRRERGTAADGDIERAETELAQTRAERPALLTTIDQQLDQIALLAGRAPGAYDALLNVGTGVGGDGDRTVAQPQPPARVPVGQPADWLRRRPDIRQAERTLAARNATVGSNVAALFPSVSVLGFLGTTGAHPGDLFKTAPLWLVTPSLTWDFLSIPANRARVRGAEADRDAALADYQRSVLAALQDANGALSQFGRQRQALAERAVARDAAARAARTLRERYAAGTASLIDALDAERQRLQTEDQWTQAAASVMVAYVSLNKSLGLGWGAPPPEDGATTRASAVGAAAAAAAGLAAAVPEAVVPPAAVPAAALPPTSVPAAVDPGALVPAAAVPPAVVPAAAAGSADVPAHTAPARAERAPPRQRDGTAVGPLPGADAGPVIDAGGGLSNAPGSNPASRVGAMGGPGGAGDALAGASVGAEALRAASRRGAAGVPSTDRSAANPRRGAAANGAAEGRGRAAAGADSPGAGAARSNGASGSGSSGAGAGAGSASGVMRPAAGSGGSGS